MGTTRPETILTPGNTSIVNTQPSQLMAIDAHHPYFLHNSDSPGINLVNATFDGKGLPGWRRSMLIALSAKKKLGFINETCASPDPQTPQYGQWSCYNDMRNFNATQRAGRGNFRNKRRKGKYDPNVSCTHCGKTGHVYDNCFRRIGFPDDFEFTKSRNFDFNKGFQGRANGAFKNGDTKAPNIQQHQGTTNANILDQLNKKKYAALVKQVAKDIKMEQTNTSAGGFTASVISGASKHMCFDSQFFTSLTPLSVPLHITLTNSSRIIVTHNGCVPIIPNLTLENVLHVPVYKYNLLYVNRLCTQYARDILFNPN
ncbi:hypothetical protein KY289_027351 [Solanum tuberosum]|nr:hypothetical protein KY289_027351 [Solanum tuberosum]